MYSIKQYYAARREHAWLLHTVWGYSYNSIAKVMDISPTRARTMVSQFQHLVRIRYPMSIRTSTTEPMPVGQGQRYPFMVLVDTYTGTTVTRQTRTFSELNSAVDYATKQLSMPRTRRVQVLAILSDYKPLHDGAYSYGTG